MIASSFPELSMRKLKIQAPIKRIAANPIIIYYNICSLISVPFAASAAHFNKPLKKVEKFYNFKMKGISAFFRPLDRRIESEKCVRLYYASHWKSVKKEWNETCVEDIPLPKGKQTIDE